MWKAKQLVVLASALFVAVAAIVGAAGPGLAAGERGVLEVKDARLKFEINATDGDGGIQVFIDADSWKQMSIYDPAGRRVFTSVTEGRMAKQGGTELFLESAEPPFTKLPVAKLLQRFPAGVYRFRGASLDGKAYAGSARLTHDLPDGPKLLSPLEGGGRQDPNRTVLRWSASHPRTGARSSATRCSSCSRRPA